ncbi:MAG: hypothetical protein WKF70_02590 [Chitinophagaceae bacterium]
MVDRFHSLAQGLLKKDLSEISTQEMQALADQYPFFSPFHFLDLKKKEGQTEAYNSQFSKSILYYHDPLTFEQFIHPVPDIGFDKVGLEFPESPIEETHSSFVEESSDLLPIESNPEWATPLPEIARQEPEPSSQAPIAPARAAADTEAFTFEPFHTVDYFASQGIKVSNTPASDDKFGKQVKSFTDWLKTMKKLPLSELAIQPTTVVDKGVESLAEHSVQDAEVVPESMAEVWAKQGNLPRAKEVYHKLSLQNPGKSAYFAAKIHELNVS